MKKIIAPCTALLSAMFMLSCNNSGSSEHTTDTSTQHVDSIVHPIVTQGGLIDSLQTGATDTTAKKDSTNK